MTVADLLAIPEGIRRHEIVDGELVQKEAASGRHGGAQARLSRKLGPYDRSPGGRLPGGWWFASEVEVQLAADEVYRPDIVGWRRENLAALPTEVPIVVRPDWSPLVSAARATGLSSASSSGRSRADAYSRSASPRSRWRTRALPDSWELTRPAAYVARKANGCSGSDLFSARWKHTRPTTDRCGAARARKASSAPSAAERRASSVLRASASTSSSVTYSAPGIGGTRATSATSCSRSRASSSPASNARGFARPASTASRPIARPKSHDGASSPEKSASASSDDASSSRASGAAASAKTGSSAASPEGARWRWP
ncbi:MAG: Uma2 family endonuclease [Deltaproteobacteria bacterium]|nr:Uma2 family endonuclease [Deltaproteobacteria bacterium]